MGGASQQPGQFVGFIAAEHIAYSEDSLSRHELYAIAEAVPWRRRDDHCDLSHRQFNLSPPKECRTCPREEPFFNDDLLDPECAPNPDSDSNEISEETERNERKREQI